MLHGYRWVYIKADNIYSDILKDAETGFDSSD